MDSSGCISEKYRNKTVAPSETNTAIDFDGLSHNNNNIDLNALWDNVNNTGIWANSNKQQQQTGI